MAKKDAEEVEFVDDLPDDGRMKYPAILEGIRTGSVGSKAGKWAVVSDFDNAPSGRDAANRLGKEHPAFEFTTRTFAEGKVNKLRIYARFIGSAT
jgi:hypothetical protein